MTYPRSLLLLLTLGFCYAQEQAPSTAAPPPPAAARQEEHPLLETEKPLAWSQLTPDRIRTDISAAMKQYMDRIRAVENVKTPTYDNTFDILLNNFMLKDTCYRVELLARVCDSPEQRRLSAEIDEKYNQAKKALFQNERIWKILKNMTTPDWLRQQNPERQRAVTELMAEFRDNGADLPPERKAQFTANENELIALKRQFLANLSDARAEWKFDITDYKKTDTPIPDEYVRQENGRLYIRHHIARTALMIFPDAKMREALWRSLGTIGKGAHDNTAIIRRILAISQQQAELLGYASHADRVADRCTMKTGAEAAEYVRSRLQQLQPAYAKGMKLLQTIKAQETGNPQAELAPWDVPYYSYCVSCLYYRHLDGIDKLLSGDIVLQRILDHISGMYGLTFVERSTVYIEPGSNKKAPAGTVEVWHPSVRYFEIIDKTTRKNLGSFYLDLEFRENKNEGTFILPITSCRHTGSTSPCVLIASSRGIKELMYPEGIQCLLHELGHTLHLILTETNTNYLGFNTIPTDFIEFPSTLHANLAKRHNILMSMLQPAFSREAYSDYNFVKKHQDIQTRFHALCDSLLDLEIHMYGNRHAEQDPDAAAKEILHDYLYLNSNGDILSEYIPYCQNTFIFEGRYAGLFYTYCLSEELAADAFSRFSVQSMLFRRTILSKGNSKPAAELYRDFMGAPPQSDAFLRSLNLDAEEDEDNDANPSHASTL